MVSTNTNGERKAFEDDLENLTLASPESLPESPERSCRVAVFSSAGLTSVGWVFNIPIFCFTFLLKSSKPKGVFPRYQAFNTVYE